jgi:hypothetical protein
MNSPSRTRAFAAPIVAWLAILLIGIAAPVAALLVLADAAEPLRLAMFGGPILALALMSAGMIGAAAAGSLRLGVILAPITAAGLVLLALMLGMEPALHPLSAALAIIIASISFAVRGALFARSAGSKGWWIAIFVVGGEVAIVATAMAMPGALPDWLLALLPAQWASVAIQTAITGSGTLAAGSSLLALAGTAAATFLVVSLWPRRWPYLVMFTAWLGLSALVWHRPAPPMPWVDLDVATIAEGA